jgi:hypothetical protein
MARASADQIGIGAHFGQHAFQCGIVLGRRRKAEGPERVTPRRATAQPIKITQRQAER